jgi:hypothetical protein
MPLIEDEGFHVDCPHIWAAAASLKFHFFATRSGQGWSCIIQTIYIIHV